MENEFLNCIKSYVIRHNNLTYNFFIDSRKPDYPVGNLSYIVENNDRTDPTTQPAFTARIEYFCDFTGEAVYNKGLCKLNELFGNEFTITEYKLNRYNH